MIEMASFHAAHSRRFLGLRTNRRGGTEVVYDDGEARRMVIALRIPRGAEGAVPDALRLAVDQARVLPALYAELARRGVDVEASAG